jgi:hypothetical protein
MERSSAIMGFCLQLIAVASLKFCGALLSAWPSVKLIHLANQGLDLVSVFISLAPLSVQPEAEKATNLHQYLGSRLSTIQLPGDIHAAPVINDEF